MSKAEEKILTVSKEELLELCRRFSQFEMTEEEYNEQEFCVDAFETTLPGRADINLEDLCSIYKMMVEDGSDKTTIFFESWSDRIIPERFSALTLPARLDFLEKQIGQPISTYLFGKLFEYHLGLPEESAVFCVVQNLLGYDGDCEKIGNNRVLESLVKLIRLELGIK